ncbi:MAG: tRNA pseudouridine(55) synthase TruB [Candidatus Eremiobacteraeota bacterium]|nr:tRNA pseudouridine(55) synthase TruB [Candidatus Eremiobacteraeota bacterium]MBV8432752.1 tRNA pseudouridine(55) synthase TruB [Candidatus Eremiobacteraeota bacterium]
MLGFVNVCKSAGPTSAHVVARLRRIYGLYARDRKIGVGHLGTLDPQAAGVLPVAVGKATRLIPMLADQRKVYACTLVLGRSTTTQDAHGETVAESPVPADWQRKLEAALPRFVGKIAQVPPMFSALHHDGKRLYELAREGKTVERRPRQVTVYAVTLLGVESPAAARLRVACGEGTYVRTLCHDIGEAIGVPAHMGALVREASGPFVLYESSTIEEIAAAPERSVIAPEHIIPFPTIVLDLRESADFRAGRVVPLPEGAAARHVFVRDESRTLVGVGEALGALLAPRKVFV